MKWSTQLIQQSPPPSAALMKWLTKPQRLSLALKKSCSAVSLQVLSERFDLFPYLDETPIFKHISCEATEYYVREVFLLCDLKPVVFAKTIMPLDTYQYYKTRLKNLGNQFIGESLLYCTPNVIRQPFEFSKLNEMHPLIKQLSSWIPKTADQELWARRSLFYINGLPMLITEVFLSEIQNYTFIGDAT